MRRTLVGGMPIKARNPENVTYFYPTDDEGNNTDLEKYNPNAEERFAPLYDDFSNKEIASAANALDINNINKANEIAGIADYLNDQARASGSNEGRFTRDSDGKKIFPSRQARIDFQEDKGRRVEKRLAEEERDANRDREDNIVSYEDDPYLQASVENTAEMFDDMNNPGGGYAQYYPGADTAFESAYKDDPTEDLLNNYIAKILQDKADRSFG